MTLTVSHGIFHSERREYMKQIPIYRKKEIVCYSQVDDEDYNLVSQYTWCYAVKSNGAVVPVSADYSDGKKTIRIHQLILPVTTHKNLQVDHIDRNPLNNCRSNLRHATASEQAYNRGKGIGNTASKYLGVIPTTTGNKWTAYGQVTGKRKIFGVFEVEEDAARARDFYMRRSPHRDRVSYNFPEIDVLPEQNRFTPKLGYKYITTYTDRRKDPPTSKFRIQITQHGKLVYGNVRLTIESAIECRDAKLKELGIKIPDALPTTEDVML